MEPQALVTNYLRLLNEDVRQEAEAGSKHPLGISMTVLTILPVFIVILSCLLCGCLMLFLCSYQSVHDIREADIVREMRNKAHQLRIGHGATQTAETETDTTKKVTRDDTSIIDDGDIESGAKQ
jgi:Fe-S oxidoreductase